MISSIPAKINELKEVVEEHDKGISQVALHYENLKPLVRLEESNIGIENKH